MAAKEEKIQYQYKTISYSRYEIDEQLNKYLISGWEIEFMSSSSSGSGSGSVYITYTLKIQKNGS